MVKSELRKKYKELRNSLTDNYIEEQSLAIANRYFHFQFGKSHTIIFFFPYHQKKKLTLLIFFIFYREKIKILLFQSPTFRI